MSGLRDGAVDLPRTDGVRAPRLWFLWSNRWWARWLIRRRYRVRIHHGERVPSTGPVILAANHIGVIDGPLLAIFSPRPAHALTKRELFAGPLGPLLSLSGQIRLDRLQTDPRAVKSALSALRAGRAVGIFPEGTRGAGTLEVFHRGAAYLAAVTGAPIVPVTMLGTRAPGATSSSLPPRGETLDLVYGEPFAVERRPWPRRRDDVGATSARLRDHMLDQIEEATTLLGRSLPGPLPAGDKENVVRQKIDGDEPDQLTEESA
ncbi:1-acyl-sn-glycerol-3-phosphate acyltransferase [Nocardioides sp. R-C-SC26]|uniref:lysophospholipid acyltransferase family protein n=1 Tax=Nocardioides sp. R-C-SC26 TaxID=2870414 RepID=UPI001E4024A3|nr:lysophospholipid acyltransferase family protein [Nocardioides sp. R-C-SC26]